MKKYFLVIFYNILCQRNDNSETNI